jgi:hypothetical protein
MNGTPTALEPWRRRVTAHFSFLEEHDFAPAPAMDFANATGLRVVYAGTTTAVAIELSYEFGRVGVLLARLRDGAFPPTPRWILEGGARQELDQVLLGIVVRLRAPEVWAATQKVRGLSEVQIEKQLKIWAEVLRRIAPEFLAGDTAALTDGEHVIHAGLDARQRSEG